MCCSLTRYKRCWTRICRRFDCGAKTLCSKLWGRLTSVPQPSPEVQRFSLKLNRIFFFRSGRHFSIFSKALGWRTMPLADRHAPETPVFVTKKASSPRNTCVNSYLINSNLDLAVNATLVFTAAAAAAPAATASTRARARAAGTGPGAAGTRAPRARTP